MNKCKQCSAPIDRGGNGKRLYCSMKCKKKQEYDRYNPPIQHECLYCKRDITDLRRDALYCDGTCGNAYNRAKRGSARDSHLKSRYGISSLEWEEMFNRQGRKCLICHRTEKQVTHWHTDHDHSCCSGRTKTCGKCVRGILCRGCNTKLGWYEIHRSELHDYLGDSWHI